MIKIDHLVKHFGDKKAVNDISFTVEEGGIRFGLVAIKNIGRGFIQALVRERQQGGLFTSFQDFCERMFVDLNRRVVENLIKCGACEKKCPVQAKYYEDAGYLYHKTELEEMYARRADNAFFL